MRRSSRAQAGSRATQQGTPGFPDPQPLECGVLARPARDGVAERAARICEVVEHLLVQQLVAQPPLVQGDALAAGVQPVGEGNAVVFAHSVEGVLFTTEDAEGTAEGHGNPAVRTPAHRVSAPMPAPRRVPPRHPRPLW